MKIKYFFLSVLACGALVACTDDSEVTESTPVQQEKGDSYMAVSIAMGGGAGTRAEDGGYDYGTSSENSVDATQAIFYFYDANDNYLTYGTVVGDLTWTNTSDPGTNVEKKSNAVVVLGPTEAVPSKVLAVLNNGTTADLQGKSLQQAVAETTVAAISTTNNFVMTNSVYMDGTNTPVYATAITSANIKETEEAALADGAPVQIYVERVAAKVSLTETATEFELTNLSPVLDDEQVSMKVVVDGWGVSATNTQSYLVKNLDGSWNATTPYSGWNNAGDFRSHWAKDANYSSTDASTGLTYISWSQATNASDAVVYCHENTVASREINSHSNVKLAINDKVSSVSNTYRNVRSQFMAARMKQPVGSPDSAG